MNIQDKMFIRSKRDSLFRQTQRYVEADNWEKLSPEQRQELKDYRQALRDVPQDFFGEIQNTSQVVWPTKPDFI